MRMVRIEQTILHLVFTFRELATATKNFRQECLLGEGGFGRVYKGTLPASGQVVAVKQLDRNGGLQGNKEFLVEVLSLSNLQHPNLVNLVGYCADGDQRILVYEYISGGSLDEHLLGKEAIRLAQPFFRDPKKFPEMADPNLKNQFPEKDLNQAVAIAAMCLQEESAVRPLIGDVVVTLSFLSTTPPANPPPAAASASLKQGGNDNSDHDSGARYDEESEEEAGETITESKDWRSNSSRKSSTRPSERSVSSSYKGSLRSEGSVSSSQRSSKRSGSGSSSKSSISSSRSGSSNHLVVGNLSYKSSRNSGANSFREDDNESVSSRGSMDGNVISSRSGSQKEKYSFDRISSIGSQGGGDEILSLQHNSSRGSHSGRLHSL
ncbi:hypothetical protein FEM48_Zijuj02G0179800 [Ziziphus jujuba var. spinosa]|uniref:Protein kinase domain-containing protein n=1 Tax=Ziziphus jujuba var. spinosa TaxID=714518 RepID=A0A978VX53_ZIZJJ|nr:hypothetical protein FEM48_Zijuj02G0179800 [Ziziphus jujuba var. spinosa]